MPKVPERPLSYGEILDNFRLKHKSRVRQKKQKRNLRKRAHRGPKWPAHAKEYSYSEIMKKLDRL